MLEGDQKCMNENEFHQGNILKKSSHLLTGNIYKLIFFRDFSRYYFFYVDTFTADHNFPVKTSFKTLHVCREKQQVEVVSR